VSLAEAGAEAEVEAGAEAGVEVEVDAAVVLPAEMSLRRMALQMTTSQRQLQGVAHPCQHPVLPPRQPASWTPMSSISSGLPDGQSRC